MTLRAIHDFELALLDPCIAMTTRGIRIDEARRLAMLAELRAVRAPLEAAASAYVTQHVLVAQAERLNASGKAHLFRKRVVCACCRNGKAKRAACWSCAGFAEKPSKKQFKDWQDSVVSRHTSCTLVGSEPLESPQLTSCTKCGGVGASESLVFNVASPAQLSVVLYELLRLPARTKDGKLTTDERALKSLLAECGGKPEARELIQSLLRLGKLDTIASILERIAPGDDGRIRTVYNPAGTETGRFASSETFLVRSTNLSNMPKREATEPMFDVRRCFIPDPGCVFVEADYSGAEMWIAAACAQDEEWLHMLRTVPKIHRWHAMQLFGLAEAEVTEQEYMKAKTAGFALNYGMQWKTFMENVNAVADRTGVAITAREAKLLCTRYVNRVHPSLPRWWDALLGELVRTGTLTTCFSRRRTFYGRNRGVRLGETHREAIAHEPQSTIADLLNRGLLRWWRQHDGHVGLLLAQVYDSLLIQARREQAQLCATLVRRCLTEEIEVHGIRLTVPVDVKVLESWAVRAEAQTC